MPNANSPRQRAGRDALPVRSTRWRASKPPRQPHQRAQLLRHDKVVTGGSSPAASGGRIPAVVGNGTRERNIRYAKDGESERTVKRSETMETS